MLALFKHHVLHSGSKCSKGGGDSRRQNGIANMNNFQFGIVIFYIFKILYFFQLIAINFCSIGIAFIDQLNEIPEIVDKILLNNAQETLTTVKAKLSVLYNSLHNELRINGYEKQLKDAIILKKVSFFEILTMKAFRIYR